MTTCYEVNDAIEGKRIACQFRKMKKVSIVAGTSRHRAMRTKLMDAYCVIIKPIKLA